MLTYNSSYSFRKWNIIIGFVEKKNKCEERGVHIKPYETEFLELQEIIKSNFFWFMNSFVVNVSPTTLLSEIMQIHAKLQAPLKTMVFSKFHLLLISYFMSIKIILQQQTDLNMGYPPYIMNNRLDYRQLNEKKVTNFQFFFDYNWLRLFYNLNWKSRKSWSLTKTIFFQCVQIKIITYLFFFFS